MTFPLNDEQFTENKVSRVSACGDGSTSFENDEGWSYFVPGESPVKPEVGQIARYYGKGIGYSVRGLFLDGQEVFYRTEDEEKIHHNDMMYGEDAADWLRRWDRGDSVWSISMGGFGPGYEQALQIAAAEVLRIFLDKKYDHTLWVTKDTEANTWKRDRDEFEKIAMPVLDKIGLSGAQWGAACSLAAKLYMLGPIAIMADESIQDRHIQISKNFPSL